MTLYNGGAIITGLVIFLIIFAFPVWYNIASGKANYVPELELPVNSKECVKDTEYMRSEHMTLLDNWRDEVVREGSRTYISSQGEVYEKSLSNTCLKCHTSKENFCDKCHNYMSVDPYCWDCHIDTTSKEFK